MAHARRPRLTAVLIPVAAASLVMLIALPDRTPPPPKNPLAADQWPGFEPRETAIQDLAGLMLKFHPERRDQALELRVENGAGLSFQWPVSDLYSGLDQHWLGLLEPGDWRVAVRTPDEPRPIAERRFSLIAGRNHGLVFDLRSLDSGEDVPMDLGLTLPDSKTPPAARVVALDDLFEARRAGEEDGEGRFLEFVGGDPAWRAEVELSPGEHVLFGDGLGAEVVLYAERGAAPLAWTFEAARAELLFVDDEGVPLPTGTELWWTASPVRAAPTIMWQAKKLVLDGGPQVFETIAGELRAVLRVPGERPTAVRVALAPGAQSSTVTCPKRPGR
ncbi:MAG: hypothetical protein GC161_06525 [Planctomycetaceae bacterium]|nr:hypothetical protein [Planctomycetaceae bacterium]